jgi:hypothetical protein
MTESDKNNDTTFVDVVPKEDPKAAFRASTMSKASVRFDIGNKGYLTDAERAARDLDTADLGQLTNEKVVMIVEETMRLREAHSSLLESMGAMKKVMLGMMFLIVVLTLCNLGTSFVAVHLAKEMEIGEGGYLRSTKDGTAIHTVGDGQVFDVTLQTDLLDDTGKPFVCLPFDEAAAIYKSARDGVATSLLLTNTTTESTSGMALTFEGAVGNETHTCLPSQGGKMICMDFASHACHPDRRNLKETNEPEYTSWRRDTFHMFVKDEPVETIQERFLRCRWCGCRGCNDLPFGSGEETVVVIVDEVPDSKEL